MAESYERMKRGLSSLGQTDSGILTVNGEEVTEKLTDYYKHYFAIATYLDKNPNDISGAYEKYGSMEVKGERLLMIHKHTKRS